MKLYILRWNPQISSYKTEDFQQRLKRIGRKGCCGLMMNWSIYEHKNLKPGDWFIFSRVGGNDDGIAGLGRFTSLPYPGDSWRRDGTQIMYADMVTLMLNDPTQSGMWKAEALETDFPENDWHGGHAGVPIAPDVAERLSIKLAKDLARLPKERIPGLAIRGGNDGHLTIIRGLLATLCS